MNKLFTTEDGTKIYLKNEYWVVNSTLPPTLITTYSDRAKLPLNDSYQEPWQMEHIKTFSTKEKAEQWIETGKVLKEGEEVVINDRVFTYCTFYDRLVDEDADKGNPAVACPKCHALFFTLSYGDYELKAHCSCGHSMTVYDG